MSEIPKKPEKITLDLKKIKSQLLQEYEKCFPTEDSPDISFSLQQNEKITPYSDCTKAKNNLSVD